jgi:hypothetical protein
MSKKSSLKIASIFLYLFGAFELLGMMMLFIPEGYMPAGFATQSDFWALISGVYGLARIVAGYAIGKNKKWGMAFGLFLCLTTMVVAPTIVPFGVLDLLLTMIITIALLYAAFGNEKILQE